MSLRRIITVAAMVGLGLSAVRPAAALQTVHLDFDTFTVPADDPDDYLYSPAERTTIKEMLEMIYLSDPGDPMGGPFGIKFEIVDPLSPPPPFTSTLVKLNAGSGGHSEKLDFRNLDDDDDVSIHEVKVLKLFVGTAKPTEFGGGVWTEGDLLTSSNLIIATANTVAHELGHSFGLRHHDSFTPIGSGISVSGDKYTPTWVGPIGTNAEFHIMGLNSAVALSSLNLLTPSWLSPRSSLKLMLNNIEDDIGPNPYVSFESEVGGDVDDSPAGATLLTMLPISIPNTNQPPDPHAFDPLDPGAGGPPMFPGRAGVFIGSLEGRDDTVDVDYFEFTGTAGEQITIEVISKILEEGDGRFDPGEGVDPRIELLDDTLLPLPYPALTSPPSAAFNDDQFESTDSILFDVILPYSGKYYIELSPSGKMGADVVGEYELFVYSIAEVPEPGAGLVMLAMAGALAGRQRSRHPS